MSVYTAVYTATYTDMVASLINYCTNPSFETNLAGWDALSGTEIEQDSTWSLYGSEAMLVTTAGYVIGEGFTGPVATHDAISDGILDQLGNPILDQAGNALIDQDTGYTTGVISMSFLSSGSGTLLFEAVDAYSMEVLGSTTVTLDGNTAWDQRVQVEFGLGPGQAYQLMVTTPSVQALSFWVDGCQYETGVTGVADRLLIPPAGTAWFGAYPGSGNAAPATYEDSGDVLNGSRKLAIVTGYQSFDTGWPTSTEQGYVGGATGRTALSYRWPCRTNAANSIGQNSGSPSTNVYWTDITAGLWDSAITTIAEGLAAYGQPIFIGFSGEFDSTANAINTVGNGDPRNFVPAYQHIWNIVAPIAPNVIWCWVPTGANLTVSGSETGTMSLEVMYPGDAYVDWICCDKYDFTLSYANATDTYTPFFSWISGGSLAGNTGTGGHDYPAGEGTTKPLGLLETGVYTSGAGAQTDANVAAWINSVPAALTSLGISMWCWFNAPDEVLTEASWPLSCTAMQNIGASPVFNPGPAASQYIDGDQPGCEWLGTPELSDSGLIYPNATGASGPMYLDGRATPVDVGSAVYTSASGSMTLSGDCAPDNNVVPVAAFTDFAIFGLTDPDPAQTFADDNNAGVDTGSGAYAQSYGIFYPPLDYPVSNGAYAWRRAAYMDVGFYFTGVPALNQEILNDIEVSLIPIGNTTPLEYTPPRQIATIIKPTRLNFCTNPAFAVDTTGWTGTGTGTIATDSTVIPTPAYDTVAQAGNLAAYFNSTGIIQDGSTGMGNFDGSTWSYSAQALAAAGLGVGAPFTSGGIGYVMPSTPPGSADNIQCLGQTISIAGVPGASVLGFAGASAGGAGTGTSGSVTITYTDGTTTVQSLGLSDWTLGSGADPVNYGNQVAGSMTYRDNSGGASANTAVYVFTATVPVNGAKTVASITLPNSEYMHIFGMSLAATSSQAYTTNSGKVTVNASGDGVEIAVPDLIVGDVYTVSFQVQAGAALASITAECGDAVPGIEGSGSDTITGVGGANLETAVWFGMSFSFVATYSTSSLLLKIAATGGSGVSYPTDFWVNSFLIETGEVVLPYFDGSFGSSDYLDYQWESGGTAGKARSYYYEQFQVKQYTVQQVLQQHIPLGLSAPPPQYLTVYTQ